MMVVPWPVPVHETAIADVGFRGISVGQLRELADYLRPRGPGEARVCMYIYIYVLYLYIS